MPGTRSATALFAGAALRLLLRLPPESAHSLALKALRLAPHGWPAPPLDVDLEVEILGQRFAHPVGLAAGFDKNGDYLDALGALGFSHIEVGTVTPRPQPGNPRPRLFRLRRERALINRMGFNNKGADHLAAQLQRARYRGIRGVSIGKNADTPLARAVDDYIECLRKLYTGAHYFAINLSSPNTERLRELQAPDALGGVMAPLQEESLRLAARHGRRAPLLLKISPDLDNGELDDLCAALIRHGLDGVIATNSSTDIPELAHELHAREGGGVSGAPLAKKSLAVLRHLRRQLGTKFPIISVGGLMTVDAVHERLNAGANLVQLYTGFVYRGPALLSEVYRSLEVSQ